MLSAPRLRPTEIREGASTGLTYRLEGELVPVLRLALDGNVSVYFEHPVLLWRQPAVRIGLHPLEKGRGQRVVNGWPLLLCEAHCAGEIAFSRDAPGQIVSLTLRPGHGVVVREHQFLAATSDVRYDFVSDRHALSRDSPCLDQFLAGDCEGVVWLHGYGTVYEQRLEADESIDIGVGGWIYCDNSISLERRPCATKRDRKGRSMASLDVDHFTGPGRVGLQSGYYAPRPRVILPPSPPLLRW